MKKRALSLMLAVLMMICFIPASAGAADEPDAPPEQPADEARYQASPDGEWLSGSLAEAVEGVYSGGRVEALRDAALGGGLAVTKNMTLASADPAVPCRITYSPKDRGDCLQAVRADVTLADIILDGGSEEGSTSESELVEVRNGRLIMAAGAVIQNNNNAGTGESCGGLRVVHGLAVMEEGSVIRNCRGKKGGGASAIYSDATFRLMGGTIENCRSPLGGGVYLEGKGVLQMADGSSIRNNTAEPKDDGTKGYGGGIYAGSGQLVLPGGEIRDNSARHGGGLYLESARAQLGSLTVEGNCAERFGGGILSTPFAAIGIGAPGVVYSPQITGNKSGEGYFDNIYLDGSPDDPRFPTQPMAVINTLGDDAVIGISRWVRPDSEHSYRTAAVPSNGYGITKADLAKIHSDDPAYMTMLRDGQIVITNADVLFDTKGHGSVPPGQRIEADNGYKAKKPADPTADGYDFIGWYETENCDDGTEWDFDTVVGEVGVDETRPVKTLYAKWQATVYSIRYQLDGGADAGNPEAYTIESQAIALKVPVKSGYTFLGWTWEGQSEPVGDATIPAGSTGDIELTANWKKNGTSDPSGPSGSSKPDAAPDKTPEGGYLSCPRDDSCPIRPFTDADPKAWYHDGVHYCIDNGLMRGYGGNLLGPDDGLTRAQLAQIIYNMTDDPAAGGGGAFDDVGPDAWYFDAVSWAARNGVVEGYGDGTFGPDDNITREQLAVMLWRYAGAKGCDVSADKDADALGYQDAGSISGWAYEAVCWASENHIVEGRGNNIFAPRDGASRAEAAAMVQRFAVIACQ